MVFQEKRSFGNWWLWVMLWIFIGSFGIAFIYQVVLGHSIGEDVLSNELIVGLLLFFLFILVFMWITRLSLHISSEGFRYQFFPWHRQPILLPWSKIKYAQVREVIVMREFGQYGLRVKDDTLSLMTQGTLGVELGLQNGAKIVFSPKKPKEVTALIQQFLSNKEKEVASA
jgi:hypothetical protein